MARDDTAHLQALLLHLSHERARLAAATRPTERAARAVWVAQLEREVAAEEAFLRRAAPLPDVQPVTDDELLAALLEG